MHSQWVCLGSTLMSFHTYYFTHTAFTELYFFCWWIHWHFTSLTLIFQQWVHARKVMKGNNFKLEYTIVCLRLVFNLPSLNARKHHTQYGVQDKITTYSRQFGRTRLTNLCIISIASCVSKWKGKRQTAWRLIQCAFGTILVTVQH